MLNIRKVQMDTLASDRIDERLRDFVDKLTSLHPKETRLLGIQEASDRTRYGLECSILYEAYDSSAVFQLAELALLFGKGFEDKEWSKQIAQTKNKNGPDEMVLALYLSGMKVFKEEGFHQ